MSVAVPEGAFHRRGESHYRRPSRRRARRRAVLAGIAALATAAAAVFMVLAARGVEESTASSSIHPPPPPMLPVRDLAKPPEPPAQPARPAYRYSVVSGGVYSPREVEQAVLRDSVVAAHYSAIDRTALRLETLPNESAAYVSYRVGDRIYWTKQKVRLPRGETVLTDGVNRIRARCGNCISLSPMLPTSDEEPGEMEFEAVIDEPPAEPHPLGSDVLPRLDSVPFPWLIGGPTDPYQPGGGILDVPIYGWFGDPAYDPPDPALTESFPGAGGIIPLPTLDSGGGGGATRPPPQQNPPGFSPPGGPDSVDPPGSFPNSDDPGDEDPPGSPNPILDPEATAPPVVAPEPGTLLLVGGGLSALIARRHRRRSRSK